MMTKLTLKEFISELDACLKKFGHDGLKEIIRGHAMGNGLFKDLIYVNG